MRNWMRLVEDAGTDYPTFEAQWGEYVADLMAEQDEEDRREVTFEWYDEVRQQLEHDVARVEFIYRTIHVAPNWITQLRRNVQQPLGVHWSMHRLLWHPGTDIYDARFTYPQGHKLVVMMMARIPPYAAIDWNASVASAMATAEDELRITEGAMIELVALTVDGKSLSLNLSRPA